MPQGPTGADEFRRNWFVLLATTVGTATGFASLVTYTFSVFIVPLTLAFGWSRQAILTAPLAMTAGVVPASFAIGWMSDRFGVWRVVAVSQCLFALALLMLAFIISDVRAYLLTFFLMALASSGTLIITFTKAVAIRFDRARGLALGVTLAGTGLCGLLAPSYATAAIAEFGWRGGYVALAFLPLVLALPFSLVLARSEAKVALGVAVAPGYATPGVSLSLAFADRRFWTMLVAFLLASGGVTGVLTNLSPILTDRGYDRTVAAAIAGGFGLSVIAARIGIGALMDRIWMPWIAVGAFLPAASGCLLLGSDALSGWAVVPALVTVSLVAGAEYDMSAFLVARVFGQGSYGRIYSVIYVAFALGGGLAPPVFGRIYDVRHSYNLALELTGLAFAVSAGLLLTIGRYSTVGAEES